MTLGHSQLNTAILIGPKKYRDLPGIVYLKRLALIGHKYDKLFFYCFQNIESHVFSSENISLGGPEYLCWIFIQYKNDVTV